MTLGPEQLQDALHSLAGRVKADPALQGTGSGDALADEITNLADKSVAYRGDVWFYRVVVGALGFAIVLSLVLAFVLILYDKSGLDFFTAIGSASVGGLVGLFAPSPVSKG